jgi:hypothetical protein
MSTLMQHLAQSPSPSASAAPASRGVAAGHRRTAIVVRAFVSIAAAIAALVLFATPTTAQRVLPLGAMPHGWYALGDKTGDYAVGTDPSRRDGGQGQGGATIRSLTEDPNGFATLQQSVRATDYQGKRVRLSGFVKSGVGALGTRSALWMRVDGPVGTESIDLMEGRPIPQGTDWARYDLVLDVPRNAVGFSFGVLLFGQGQVWLDDVAVERVGRDVPLTGRPGHMGAAGTSRDALRAEGLRRRQQDDSYRLAQLQPVNLSFTDGAQAARRR